LVPTAITAAEPGSTIVARAGGAGSVRRLA
jgi:hypothetical protein